MPSRSLLPRIAFYFGVPLQDLRFGCRLLVKEKGFSALAVGVLALGIGAVTTQFAVVNGVLLRGLSFPNAERLVSVELGQSESDAALGSKMAPADFVDLQAQQTAFESMAACLKISAANVNYKGATERRPAGYVTHDFFRVLGAVPALGRDFSPYDDQTGVAPSVILSDALWREAFDADPGIVGRTLRVNGRVGSIIGVMPRGFSFPHDEQLWIALRSEFPVKPRHEHSGDVVSIYARLKPGVTLAQGSAEVALLAERIGAQHPENAGLRYGRVRPLISLFTTPQMAGLLYTLLAFCGGVLLIACVNVANMQFARATLRMHEMAVRASFGATRGRLLCQMLAENLILAASGAVLGCLLSLWTVSWLDRAVRHFTPPLPGWMRFAIDGPVLGCVVAAMIIATVGAGLLPGLAAARVGLATELKEGGRGTTGRRAGVFARALVVFQIVVTCILLVGSLLQLRSILRQQRLDHGYDTASVLTARYMLMSGAYPTDASRLAFHEKLLGELRSDPSLESAAFSERYRMIYLDEGPVEIEGRPLSAGSSSNSASSERVTDGYFQTLGQRLSAGRDFLPAENDLKQPVAIVNESFVRRHFPDGVAVGRRFRPVNPDPKKQEPWRAIVGVVSDVRMSGPFSGRTENVAYYLPFTASLYTSGRPSIVGQQYVTIVVRPRGGVRAEASLAAVRAAVSKIDPDLPLYFIGTPQAQFETFLGQTRLITLLSLAVGGVAIVLAAAGLYGVTAHSVNRRRQEFGIRLALGSGRRQLLAMVLGQVGWQLALGLLLGLAGAAALVVLGRTVIAESLFETDPLDPLTYAAVASVLTIAAALAAFVPAQRATRVDPVVALRGE